MQSDPPIEVRVKTIMLGDSGAGKTSFVECFKNGPKESRATTATTGPEYISYKCVIGSVALRVNIWDTAGQEAYRSLNRNFYRESKGGMIIVDLADAPKKENLEYWYNEFKTYSDQKSQVVLVGNKADLDKDENTVAILEEFAKQKGISLFEVSAKTGFNVETAMLTLIHNINSQYYQDPKTIEAAGVPNNRQRREFQSSLRLDEDTVLDKSSGSISKCNCN